MQTNVKTGKHVYGNMQRGCSPPAPALTSVFGAGFSGPTRPRKQINRFLWRCLMKNGRKVADGQIVFSKYNLLPGWG